MGSRRSYYINAPTLGGTTKIQTIIPDAYMVNIKLTGLVSETQNFLYHMLGGKQGIVNVIESIGGRTPVSSFLDGLNRGSGLNL
jgi:NADP-dependent 3-hydroxy acid dehydrogenase YdfG